MEDNTFRARMNACISIAAFFLMNVCTVLLNKYIFARMKFTYPMTLTCIHFATCSVGSFLVLRVFKMMQFQRASANEIVGKLLPYAALLGFNIVLGNISLQYIHVSFFQTVKSSVPAWTVLLQLLVLRMQFDRKIYISLIPICGGVALASWTEVNFHTGGFIASLINSVGASAQTVAGSYLMERSFDAINLLYYMAPLALMLLAPIAALVELRPLASSHVFADTPNLATVLVISGVVAFLLNGVQLWAIASTSSLTFNVCGNVKAAFAVVFSVLLFGNEISLLNGVGATAAIGGAVWYGILRQQLAAAAKAAVALDKEPLTPMAGDSEPMSPSSKRDLYGRKTFV